MIKSDKVATLDKKFSDLLTKLESYSGTDPESVVHKAYDDYFKDYFELDDSAIIRVEKCDSYFTSGELTVLVEYKYDWDFRDSRVRYKAIAQTLFYYKRIKDSGNRSIPNVIFIGDVNECFSLKASHLDKYLNLDGVDYSVAPSDAGSQMILVDALMNDAEIKHEIFVINPQKDKMSDICTKMIGLSKNENPLIPINKKNIRGVFERFLDEAVNDPKYDANEIVGLFIDAIKYPEKRIIANDTMVVYPYKPIRVNATKAIALFNFFGSPTDEDARNLAMIYDTLVKDSERRKKGFFITPTIWVDLAHKYVGDYFESIGWDRNWEDNENVVVWDCCCGTKSLTRDYRFKNLYLSTLEEGELNASVELSPEAKETFIFDFLNDLINKLPASLTNELKELHKNKDKKLVFLVNPPYGSGTGLTNDSKTGQIMTQAAIGMKANNIAYRSMDLFVQFLYRMNEICNYFKLNKNQVLIATFSNPTWLNGLDCQKFRDYWFKSWTYDTGFMFNASEFAGCSSAWGVKVTLMHNNSGKQTNDFECDIYENKDGVANQIGTKTILIVPEDKSLHKCIRDKSIHTIKMVGLKNGLVAINSNKCSKMGKDALGWFNGARGNIMQNNFNYITSAPSDSHGTTISFNNVDLIVQDNAVCHICEANWINDKDYYSKPDESHPKYQEWIRDCYANTIDSLVTSMSGVVDGEAYDYKNNFFPFTKSYTYQLLGKTLLKNEADESRWCLANGKFDNPTPEGQAVLDAFANLIKASAPYRDEYNRHHPELQLDHWDAGYRQMRDLFKEVCPNELKEYKAALKALKDKMRPMIYELGFLRK